jgi:hypothetical protein
MSLLRRTVRRDWNQGLLMNGAAETRDLHLSEYYLFYKVLKCGFQNSSDILALCFVCNSLSIYFFTATI